MYTIEELIEIAGAKGVKVTARQIKEWNKDSLLPSPTRERIPGQGRGRAPYQFPEPAPAVVVTLANERRYMKSAKDAKLWLWLEGFDHTDVDPDEHLQEWLVRGWKEEVQAKCPSVPDPAEVDQINYDRHQQILDELDRNVISQMGNRDPRPEEYTLYSSLLSAFLGLAPSEDDEPLQAGRASHKLLPFSVQRVLPSSFYSKLPDLLPKELVALSLPDAIGEPIPRQQVRDIWKTFCTVTDIPDEPLERFPFGFAVVIKVLRKLRYATYQDCPEYVIYGLSCAVRYLLRTHPNPLQDTMKAMQHLRKSLEPLS
jgi:hypothetical protein